MCGIGGFLGRFDPHALPEMAERLAHRGPDDEGISHDPNHGLGLVHRRLAIQDLSAAGHQPMWSDDGRVAVVFNGEIYNFHELREQLQDSGTEFRGHSDTEVLLALYLNTGCEMLKRLNGIFAFAIWDAAARELFLARDSVGVKPLYYLEEARGFAFGSEIKALAPVLNEELMTVDPASLNRYLTFLWCPGKGTPVTGIRKLDPGEAMLVGAGGIRERWQWYRLPACRSRQRTCTEAEAVDGTARALRGAVHRQLVSDVEVGAFLSGGLDSSAVVAMARERIPDIRCFTIETRGGAESGMEDDLGYARHVARHLGVTLDVIPIDAKRMAADLEDMVYQLDEPLADPAALNVRYITRLAREQGIKVLLSGVGGDDLFTGYRRHLAIHCERYWTWLPVGVRRQLARTTAGLDQRRPIGRRLAKLFAGAALDARERLIEYYRWSGADFLDSLYTSEFRARLGDATAARPMEEMLDTVRPDADRIEQALTMDQRFFLTDHNLTYTDKMSMANGVEVRVPFLDPDLMEFADRVPTGLKQRGRQGKWVLKKAMEPYLPREVIYRPKRGFGAPLRRWMRHELRELLGDVLSDESLRRRGFFEPAAVDRLIRQNDRGEVDASYTLFSLLCIELWFRKFSAGTTLAAS